MVNSIYSLLAFAVENNALSNWGALVPPATQQDASLAFDLGGNGVANDKIIKAVDNSRLGPSWGTEYKIKPYIKGEVVGGYFGKYAPALVSKFGIELPNFVYGITGSYIYEYGNDATKILINKVEDK